MGFAVRKHTLAGAIDSEPAVQTVDVSQPGNTWLRWFDWFIAILLALGAFLPRLISAINLDVSTDEPIYTIAGNIYYNLLRTHDFKSDQWLYNYEHPAFAKLLMGASVYISKQYFNGHQQLLEARIPGVILGTVMIAAIYLLGRAPFGRAVSLLAALCLLVSPWVIFFNAEALLDTTMTVMVTLAYLILWHALRRPSLYAVLAILIGLAAASKYPAIFALPGVLLFTGYYYFVLRRHLPVEQRLAIPWKWWLIAIVLAPCSFLLADPAIWANPIHRLINSYQFSLSHAEIGHRSFWAGQVYTHEPGWIIFYILAVKLSAFVTVPTLLFLGLGLYRLIHFHIRKKSKIPSSSLEVQAIASTAFLFIWLGSFLAMFSRFTIVVGTHYYLPLATPIALAAAVALTTILRYKRGSLLAKTSTGQLQASAAWRNRAVLNPREAAILLVLMTVLIGPHLMGLLTIPELEGYTSEFFQGEDPNVQVAYSGYREADQWLVAHARAGGRVAIVGGSATTLWYIANARRIGKLTFTVVPFGTTLDFADYDYLVWPEHLEQRGFLIPATWSQHIVHTISGGNTSYCFILARDVSSLKHTG